MSKALTGTKTPVRRCSSRCSASSSGSRSGSIDASTARAVSGAGTKLRRRSFGNDLISAVTSSSRRAGTCQPKLVATQAGQHLDGNVHGHPVVGRPRFEPVGQRQRQILGCPVVRSDRHRRRAPAADRRGLKVSRSGVVWRCFFHQPSKWRDETTCADATVVQRVDLVVIDQQVAAAARSSSSSIPHAARRCRERSGGGSASRRRRERDE